ncbi:hypothetical protein MTO96_031858 [Rhipicephalus appendiculatus]
MIAALELKQSRSKSVPKTEWVKPQGWRKVQLSSARCSWDIQLLQSGVQRNSPRVLRCPGLQLFLQRFAAASCGFLLTLAHGLLQMFFRYARATVHISELRSRRKRDVQPPHQHRNQRRLEEISDCS